MDYGGVVGIEGGGLGGSSSQGESTRQKVGFLGSGFHTRHFPAAPQRGKGFSSSSSSSSSSLFSDGKQQQMMMINFSSPNGGGSPYYHHHDGGSEMKKKKKMMHGVLAGVSGPFTPSQWLELEHQALIYKYLDANMPVPANLLVPIRKSSLNSSGFSSYAAAAAAAATTMRTTNSVGWGAFHAGFTGTADPEPGRCRRTDGKKWRCSRDAVVDQKYCERHMNRGRHRSRKPVEAHSGHPPAKAAAPPPPPSTLAVSGIGSSAGLGIAPPQQQQPQKNRFAMAAEHLSDQLSCSPTRQKLKKEASSTLPDQQRSLFHEFGGISSENLLGPPRSSFMEMRSGEEPQEDHPLRHFFDDWQQPKEEPFRPPSLAWPEEEAAPPSCNSPTARDGTTTLCPLRLSREADHHPVYMSLAIGGAQAPNEAHQRPPMAGSWIPVSWEPSMGGPLGEALNKTSSNNPVTGDGIKTAAGSSVLNLMAEGWLGSSPTGVLQKAAVFCSMSGSTGNSPPAETQQMTCESPSCLCDDLLLAGPPL
ncbi:unnamed protein product [Spirodela intermedia]|uniref:Growth-regulating factor n=1 Tax=Spirodela intermedia TaxID=51605 RepID=A0A7I8JVW9_SPIIN|nr:unnamed protein product [Spirodela intermedia]